jgi:hypothetical protein
MPSTIKLLSNGLLLLSIRLPSTNLRIVSSSSSCNRRNRGGTEGSQWVEPLGLRGTLQTGTASATGRPRGDGCPLLPPLPLGSMPRTSASESSASTGSSAGGAGAGSV